MTEHKVPGAALAIARDGQVIYARGYGYADQETQTLVQPDTLFRIASVSKVITGVAIMKLFQDGKLRLEDKILDYIPNQPFRGGKFDERWRQITIAMCLTHTGGWDREQSFDPMLENARVAAGLGAEMPLTHGQIFSFMLGQPLDFDPGSRYAYSNFGCAILGRVIEQVSGQTYEEYVQQAIFQPLGLVQPRIGGSLAQDRLEGEVKYYTPDNKTHIAVVGPEAGKAEVPINYGGWNHRQADANGGWVMSAIDLVKFGVAFDYTQGNSQTRGGILSVDTARLMFSPQVSITLAKADEPAEFYGYSWILTEHGDKLFASHGGVLPGTAANLIHVSDGTNVALITNLGQTADGAWLGRMLKQPLVKLIQDTQSWS
jgi:N-acyl-D-amino-acid deacylase